MVSGGEIEGFGAKGQHRHSKTDTNGGRREGGSGREGGREGAYRQHPIISHTLSLPSLPFSIPLSHHALAGTYRSCSPP